MKQIEQHVYDTILRSSETRISYLALNMQWMEDQLAPDAQSKQDLMPVHLTMQTFHTIDKEMLPRSTITDNSNVNHNNEELQVRAYVLPSSFLHNDQQHAQSQRKRYEAAIDQFFALNPCWVPIQEPAMYDKSTLLEQKDVDGNLANDSSRNSRGRSNSNSSSSISSSSSEGGSDDLNQLLIIAHLPRHGFLATCQVRRHPLI